MTGSTNQNNPTSLTAFLDAARQGDLSALSQRIDFALSGLAPMVRALWNVDEADRDSVARVGLAELETVTEHSEILSDRLENLRRAFARMADVHPASASQTENALALLRVPDIPPGLSPEIHARLEALVVRSKALGDVYEATIPGGTPLLLAVVPDTERIAISLE